MIDRFTQRWCALTGRERQFLQWGGLAAVSLLLLIGLRPGYQQLQLQQARNIQLLQQQDWLTRESAAIVRWKQQFNGAPLGVLSSPRAAAALLHDGLARYRLQGTVTGHEALQVRIDAGVGDRVLAYLEAVVGAGLLLERASLSRTGQGDAVQAQLIFRVVP